MQMSVGNRASATPEAFAPDASALLQEQRADPARFPLSFGQERLWFLEQLQPNTARYNVPLAIRLSGALRVDLLQSALNAIIARHEALRTNFVSDGGRSSQVIRDPFVVPITLVDLAPRAMAEREDELHALLRRAAER